MKKILLVFCFFQLSIYGFAEAAPKAELWSFWLANDPASLQVVDHHLWQEFLNHNLVPGRDGINRLTYAKISPEDKKRLDDYLEQLTAVSVTKLKRSQQKAFWINLYNALTVKVVLDYYPVKSINDIAISPGWFVRGPWGKTLLAVEGRKLSLDDIEHRILRPVWSDPLVHYAVNCASLSCPNLQAEAFTGANLERLLEQGARDYINHPRGARFEQKRLVVSSIYKWFADDFGTADQAVIEHLKRYAAAPLRQQLQAVTKISAYDYDWHLNDVAAAE
ncbi:MAG: DUF547 domain-containing protein [Deltaproteobacteria bacterium]|nr:DUF547 domain-containing protein [Deltaproteobacteria bacterium]